MDILSALAGLAGLALILWSLVDLFTRVRALEKWKAESRPRCDYREDGLVCCLQQGHGGSHLHRFLSGAAIPFHMKDAAKHG